MKRIVYLSLGIIFTGFGFAGIVLPLVPTTPFLLLAAFFFSKSSDKFHDWLLSNRICGEYIRNYKEKRGMKLRDKVTSLSMLWIAISASAFLATDKLWLRILLFAIATGVTIHLTSLKTIRD